MEAWNGIVYEQNISEIDEMWKFVHRENNIYIFRMVNTIVKVISALT